MGEKAGSKIDSTTFDASLINPVDVLKQLQGMYEEDFLRYTDQATGRLKSELAVPVENCPACAESSTRSNTIFKKGPFEYSQCSNCEMVYVNPHLNDAQTELLYREGRCMYQLKHFYLPYADYRSEKIYLPKLKDIKNRFGTGELLDFGCSTGYFLKAANELGFTVAGVELNPFGVKWAREELGLEHVYDKLLEECGFAQRQFDLVTMWDVLEHVSNPFDILTSIRPFLKADGTVVAETSHYDCLEQDILGAENTNVVGDMHPLHFTTTSITALFNRAGFKIVDVDIFGLDIQHILNYQKLNDLDDFKIPAEAVPKIQNAIDSADKGCYIKVYAQPS